ncbi:cytochrome P450 [Lentinula raphanica]|nr:cytochrome P450 [Lentinula raphanica]
MLALVFATSFLVALGALLVGRSAKQPLKQFPGPSLARWTTLYKAYFEIVKKGGWVRQLEKLHAAYGPIVRVGPNELHFSDPRAYGEIYAPGSRFHKDMALYSIFKHSNSSVFTTPDPHDAAVIRNVLSPYFSRRAIIPKIPLIKEQVTKLISILKTHTSESENPVNLDHALPAVALDAFTSLIFSRSFDTLSAPGFDHPFIRGVPSTYINIWVKKYFPRLKTPLMLAFMRFLSLVDPIAITFADQLKLIIEDLKLALQSTSTPDESPLDEASTDGPLYPFLLHKIQSQIQKPTMTAETSEQLRDLLQHNRLVAEGFNLRFAGADTVGTACTVGVRCLLSNRDVLVRLVRELDEAWPNEGDIAFEDLEKLPYLTAVIKESLRLSHGVVTPLGRVVGPGDAVIVGETIPTGTIVGISSTFVHLNAEIFPEPTKFHPDRWLKSSQKSRDQNEEHSDSSAVDVNADKYLVSFSRGPRSCFGIHLAWCELYIIFGYLFRMLELIPQTELNPNQPLQFDDFFLPTYVCDPLLVFVRERTSLVK